MLVGCGTKASGLQTLECTTAEEGMEMVISLGIEKEELTNMGVVAEISYEDLGMSKDDIDDESRKMIEAIIKAQFAQFGDSTIEFTDTGMHMDIKLTKEGLTEIGAFDSGDVDLNEKIDINQLKKTAEASGAQCIIK